MRIEDAMKNETLGKVIKGKGDNCIAWDSNSDVQSNEPVTNTFIASEVAFDQGVEPLRRHRRRKNHRCYVECA